MNQSPPLAEIFSQGDEIVSGQTTDTNAAWLSEQLVRMGFQVTRHTAVGDRLESLVELLREIASRADSCICTGGLGPTSDDLTAEAVAAAFDRPLITDLDALVQIEAHFTRTGREMPLVNLKQALLPDKSARIDNQWGTAPGFSLRHGRCWFAFLPGVPFEMEHMFLETVRPELTRTWRLDPMQLVTVRCAGIGESAIQERLGCVAFPDKVRLSFRTGPIENQIKLLFQPDVPQADIQALAERVAGAIGSPVFGIDGLEQDSGDLVTVIARQLTQNHQRLSVLETLSAGAIASRCGGARWFKESRVIRDRAEVFKHLAVSCPADSNEESSGKEASVLASALAEHCGSDFALAQLWNFDDRALADRNAVISVYTGLATPTGTCEHSCKLTGTASRKQTVAATQALDLLRRYLQGCL
ncbi:MAG: molybdopterin-binding protein [Methylococcaceae bacterium]|nr:molybdopterin-binding protein [Methylococcaceae bacterium]